MKGRTVTIDGHRFRVMYDGGEMNGERWWWVRGADGLLRAVRESTVRNGADA